MSILAEPKRKTVWSLNPRGKYWSEDKSKLGQKLLESMGWKEGLGLGKNNNGITDNIRVGVNSDNKGLGYKPNADKVWVDKNQDFEQLLANLAVHHNNTSITKVDKVSNLEEQSKKLRNRLHYNKLIKAKNLSQCSEKDLISIFPKKLDNSDGSQSSEQNYRTDSAKETNGYTFESKTNINDYFKSKMDKIKLKFQLNKIHSKLEDNDDNNNNNNNEITKQTISDFIEEENSSSSSTSLKSKKRKNQQMIESSDNSTVDSIKDSNIKQKKSKKSKTKDELTVDNSLEQQSDHQIVAKKKKNKKLLDANNLEERVENSCESTPNLMDIIGEEVKVNKKDKKKRKKPIAEIDVEMRCESTKSKKKKKLNPEECQSLVPKGYDSTSMSVSNSLKNYHKIRDAIQKDRALSTTNMMALKGYGCH